MKQYQSDLAQFRKDEYYLSIAETVASKSTCCRRAYGAIIVKNDEIIATGYNGSPRGCINCTEVGCMREVLGVDKGDSYNLCTSVHAEQNAIISAARKDMLGATLYIVGINRKPELAEVARYADPSPCLLCHRMIVNAGITRVVGRKPDPEDPCLHTVETIDVGPHSFMMRIQQEYHKTIDKLKANPNITDEERSQLETANSLIATYAARTDMEGVDIFCPYRNTTGQQGTAVSSSAESIEGQCWYYVYSGMAEFPSECNDDNCPIIPLRTE